MSSLSSYTMLSDELLDELALAAVVARNEGVDRSQVNKLIEFLESTDSFTLMLFLARQVARGQWSRSRPSSSAARLFKALLNIATRIDDEAKRKDVLRRALGYFKWFYESFDLNRNVFSELQRRFGAALSQAVRDPRQAAPRNFAKEYLKALMRI